MIIVENETKLVFAKKKDLSNLRKFDRSSRKYSRGCLKIFEKYIQGINFI